MQNKKFRNKSATYKHVKDHENFKPRRVVQYANLNIQLKNELKSNNDNFYKINELGDIPKTKITQ